MSNQNKNTPTHVERLVTVKHCRNTQSKIKLSKNVIVENPWKCTAVRAGQISLHEV